MTTRRLTAATLAATLTAFASMTAPAAAQQPPNTHGDFTFNPNRIERGNAITFTGHCIWNGHKATHMNVSAFHQTAQGGLDDVVGHTFEIVNDDGGVVGALSFPGGVPLGNYQVTASCFDDDQGFYGSPDAPLTVVAAGSLTATTTSTTKKRTTTTRRPATTTTATTTTLLAPATTATTEPASTTTTSTTALAVAAPPRPSNPHHTTWWPAALGGTGLATATLGIVITNRRRRQTR